MRSCTVCVVGYYVCMAKPLSRQTNAALRAHGSPAAKEILRQRRRDDRVRKQEDAYRWHRAKDAQRAA